MGTLFRDGDKPSQKVLGIITGYMNRVGRPVYLGFISLEIRWSLERTKEMMDTLEDQGVVRLVPREELKAKGFPVVAVIYELVDAPQLSKACL